MPDDKGGMVVTFLTCGSSSSLSVGSVPSKNVFFFFSATDATDVALPPISVEANRLILSCCVSSAETEHDQRQMTHNPHTGDSTYCFSDDRKANTSKSVESDLTSCSRIATCILPHSLLCVFLLQNLHFPPQLIRFFVVDFQLSMCRRIRATVVQPRPRSAPEHSQTTILEDPQHRSSEKAFKAPADRLQNVPNNQEPPPQKAIEYIHINHSHFHNAVSFLDFRW